MNTRDQYLHLMKLVLTGMVYAESWDVQVNPRSGSSPRAIIQNFILRFLAIRKLRLVKSMPHNPEARAEGKNWPSIAYTMVGLKRLDNIQNAIATVLKENVPGDICECGVWRGGCSIFMKAVLQVHGESTRTIWVADSFEGLPKPNLVKYPDDKGSDLSEIDYLSVPVDTVKQNFTMFGLLDERVKFLKGWFKDTLPDSPIKQLAVLRADGDLYESTVDILYNLYDKVSPGGFVIIDDYGAFPQCKKAVDEFREKRKITSPIQRIDWTGVYWRA